MGDKLFDDVFDFNNDGEIDYFEESIEQAFLEIEDAELKKAFSSDADDFDIELDLGDLSLMDKWEIREKLEMMGLDPDDYDLDDYGLDDDDNDDDDLDY